ncbi:DUF167 domain-containing protein [Undibacterium arcticum]|uniref:UPF0235 protein ACFOFO_14130 n=1 Tax=Undibacterium arcticum TaxID=1762892 RepID=A0ABV7F2C2_9BURK
MSRSWCTALPAGIRLALQISANAKQSGPIEILDDVLKLRLQAPALEGRANEALIRYLADLLKLPKAAIRITHGLSNKRKLIEIAAPHLTVDDVTNAFFPTDK